MLLKDQLLEQVHLDQCLVVRPQPQPQNHHLEALHLKNPPKPRPLRPQYLEEGEEPDNPQFLVEVQLPPLPLLLEDLEVTTLIHTFIEAASM